MIRIVLGLFVYGGLLQHPFRKKTGAKNGRKTDWKTTIMRHQKTELISLRDMESQFYEIVEKIHEKHPNRGKQGTEKVEKTT